MAREFIETLPLDLSLMIKKNIDERKVDKLDLELLAIIKKSGIHTSIQPYNNTDEVCNKKYCIDYIDSEKKYDESQKKWIYTVNGYHIFRNKKEKLKAFFIEKCTEMKNIDYNFYKYKYDDDSMKLLLKKYENIKEKIEKISIDENLKILRLIYLEFEYKSDSGIEILIFDSFCTIPSTGHQFLYELIEKLKIEKISLKRLNPKPYEKMGFTPVKDKLYYMEVTKSTFIKPSEANFIFDKDFVENLKKTVKEDGSKSKRHSKRKSKRHSKKVFVK
jgi:hypothetical protein